MKILITGASSGIGLYLSQQLTAEEIWGISRRPVRLAGLRHSICDITDWLQVQALAVELRQEWNKLDAVIHCAGTQGEIGPAMDVDPIRWVETVQQNIAGAYFLIRGIFPLLAPRPESRPKVILFSGGGASQPRPNFSAYGCAKTALVRLTEQLATEWGTSGPAINIVAPGAINTAMTEEVVLLGPDKVGSAEFERAQKQLATGGDDPTQLLTLIRFLLSPAAEMVSGRFISAKWDSVEDLLATTQSSNKQRFTLRRVTS
ncbi:MAG: SDR family oxidoreductase [Verrucomicrobia bacterium]|nr:SDR family oxidoreductase [Verrucomicrobiota bacterium]